MKYFIFLFLILACSSSTEPDAPVDTVYAHNCESTDFGVATYDKQRRDNYYAYCEIEQIQQNVAHLTAYEGGTNTKGNKIFQFTPTSPYVLNNTGGVKAYHFAFYSNDVVTFSKTVTESDSQDQDTDPIDGGVLWTIYINNAIRIYITNK